MSKSYNIKDASLAKEGSLLVQWAMHNMPVLKRISQRFEKLKPLNQTTIGCCLHVTKETAVLMKALKVGGAKIFLCGSNPLSTNDKVAALLAEKGIHVYAWHGMSDKEYFSAIDWLANQKPNIVMDDGGDLTVHLHEKCQENFPNIIAGTEETTTGLTRDYALEREGALKFPIIAVNNAKTKRFFDNRYGTGQSTLDGVMRATSLLLAGKVIVVAGYGWCGRGIAWKAKGMGAKVIITEVDEIKALEAWMDGFEVMPMEKACTKADLILTATGNKAIVGEKIFKKIKNGCILANAGHFDVEVDVSYLNRFPFREVRPNVKEYKLNDKKVYLLAEGRLVNLACAEGHPPEVMDMSFANQALVAQWLVTPGVKKKLKAKVYPVPEEIDTEVAKEKLKAIGIQIDKLSKEQTEYLRSWKLGT
jgi:adenosylhomocysteinase